MELFNLYLVSFEILGPMNLKCNCKMVLREGQIPEVVLKETFIPNAINVRSEILESGEPEYVLTLYNRGYNG